MSTRLDLVRSFLFLLYFTRARARAWCVYVHARTYVCYRLILNNKSRMCLLESAVPHISQAERETVNSPCRAARFREIS